MRTKHTTITATALLALATLTACTPTNNENPNQTQTQTQTTNPTPTNTTDNTEPIKSDPPKTEQEATQHAEQALQTWLTIEGDIRSNTPNDTSRAPQYATGQELKDLDENIRLANENGFDFDGQVTITIDSNQSTTTPRNNGDQQMEFASVHLYGCGDISTLGGVSTKTGEPIKYEGDSKSHPLHINVIYDPPTKTWLVNSSEKDWENKDTRC